MYIRSHGDEFYINNSRTPEGLLKLLTAIHLRKLYHFNKYKKTIVEMINRSDYDGVKIDSLEMGALIASW